jgi:hypothetical protein
VHLPLLSGHLQCPQMSKTSTLLIEALLLAFFREYQNYPVRNPNSLPVEKGKRGWEERDHCADEKVALGLGEGLYSWTSVIHLELALLLLKSQLVLN